MPKLPKLVASVLILSGLALLTAIFTPIVASTVRFRFFSPPKLIDPSATGRYPMPKIITALGVTTVDYSDASRWFTSPPTAVPVTPRSGVSFFTLSIPSIGILNTPVEINGTNLKKNAVHYPGTTLPGTVGNSVILGHSALPGLYKKDNPLVVFNPLPQIKVGADVTVKYDGLTYRYVVKKIQEVTPSQVEVLAPTPDRYQLTLITCVPLGTYWRRFVATADLVN